MTEIRELKQWLHELKVDFICNTDKHLGLQIKKKYLAILRIKDSMEQKQRDYYGKLYEHNCW